jgi:hypothetical protein
MLLGCPSARDENGGEHDLGGGWFLAGELVRRGAATADAVDLVQTDADSYRRGVGWVGSVGFQPPTLHFDLEAGGALSALHWIG